VKSNKRKKEFTDAKRIKKMVKEKQEPAIYRAEKQSSLQRRSLQTVMRK